LPVRRILIFPFARALIGKHLDQLAAYHGVQFFRRVIVAWSAAF